MAEEPSAHPESGSEAIAAPPPVGISPGRLVKVRVGECHLRFVPGCEMAAEALERAVLGLKAGEETEYEGQRVVVEEVGKEVGAGEKEPEERVRELREKANALVRECTPLIKQQKPGKSVKGAWQAKDLYQEAIELCRRHGGMDDLLKVLYGNLVVVLGILGKWAECRASAWEAIDQNMESKKTWYWLARAEREAGVMEEAIRCLEKAVEFDRDDLGLKRELMVLRERRKKRLFKERDAFAEVYNRKLDSSIYSEA